MIFYTDITRVNKNLLFLRYGSQLYSVLFLRKEIKSSVCCYCLLWEVWFNLVLLYRDFASNPCRPIIAIDFLSIVCQEDDDEAQYMNEHGRKKWRESMSHGLLCSTCLFIFYFFRAWLIYFGQYNSELLGKERYND